MTRRCSVHSYTVTRWRRAAATGSGAGRAVFGFTASGRSLVTVPVGASGTSTSSCGPGVAETKMIQTRKAGPGRTASVYYLRVEVRVRLGGVTHQLELELEW